MPNQEQTQIVVAEIEARHRAELAAAEERGRRRGVEAAQLAVDAVVAVCDLQQDLQYRNGALMAAEAVRALAPRDSAPAKMDASGGPRCWCGKTSRHESGWCGGLACQGGAPRDSGKDIERIKRMEDGLAAAPGVVGGAAKTTVTLPDTPGLTALKALVDSKAAPDSVTPSALPRDEGKDAIGLSQDELDDIEADAYVRGMGDRE